MTSVMRKTAVAAAMALTLAAGVAAIPTMADARNFGRGGFPPGGGSGNGFGSLHSDDDRRLAAPELSAGFGLGRVGAGLSGALGQGDEG